MNIKQKYEILGESSRKVEFEVNVIMGPLVSGVKRSLLIPPYARKSSSMIKAYCKLHNANKPSTGSRKLK